MEREALRRSHFHKYTALGNDYLVLDPYASALAPSPDRIRALCDRHNGIGADGVVFGPEFDAAGQMRIRIFNPDGSEAEKSGNGIRIFARYAFEAGYVSREPFTLATRGGPVTVRVLDDAAALIEVDMGKPSFRSADIPMSGPDREVVDEPLVARRRAAARDLRLDGESALCGLHRRGERRARPEPRPAAGKRPCFPQRANVQFVRVLNEGAIAIQIWERGAGYTLASGSSSCAAASAARRLGLVGDSVVVSMPGGSLKVAFRPDGHAILTGPVTGVAHGFFHADLSS